MARNKHASKDLKEQTALLLQAGVIDAQQAALLTGYAVSTVSGWGRQLRCGAAAPCGRVSRVERRPARSGALGKVVLVIVIR